MNNEFIIIVQVDGHSSDVPEDSSSLKNQLLVGSVPPK
jgi:hypothetical protein